MRLVDSISRSMDYLKDASNHTSAFRLRNFYFSKTLLLNGEAVDRDVFNFVYEFYKQNLETYLPSVKIDKDKYKDKDKDKETLLLFFWDQLREIFKAHANDKIAAIQFRHFKKLFNRLAREHEVAIRLRHCKKNQHGIQYSDVDAKYKVLQYALCTKQGMNEIIKGLATDDVDVVKRMRRSRQNVLNLSLLASVLVAIGEAIVAAHLAPVLLASKLLNFCAVFACALVSNFILFRAASVYTFKQLAFGRVYITEDNEDLSTKPLFSRLIMPSVLFLTVSSGLVYFFLSMGSSFPSIGHIFPALLVAGTTPYALLVISSVLAVAAFLSLTSLFYSSAVKDIKSGIIYKLYVGGWKKMPDILAKYVHAIFANSEGCVTVSSVAKVLLKKSIVIAAFIFVSISTYGLFNAMTIYDLHGIWHVSSVVAHGVNAVLSKLALPVNLYFQFNSIELCLDLTLALCAGVQKKMAALCLWAYHSVTQSASQDSVADSQESKQPPVNAIRQLEQWYASACFTVAGLCVCVNGGGQGWGVTKPGDVSLVHNVLHFLSRPFIMVSNCFTKMACSNGANLQQSYETTHAGLESSDHVQNSVADQTSAGLC